MKYSSLNESIYSDEDFASVRNLQFKQLENTLKKEKNFSFYQLLFICSVIYNVINTPQYDFNCKKIAKILKGNTLKMKCNSSLDTEAKSILIEVTTHLSKYNNFPLELCKKLNDLRFEYYNILYTN